MSSRDFLAQAAATLEAALAMEGRQSGAVALEKAYSEAVQAVQYASAFEDRGAAFQAAQDGVVEVPGAVRRRHEQDLGGLRLRARRRAGRGTPS